MTIDVGTDFKIRAFLENFIQYQMYKKLSHEIVILIYEIVMKSASFLYNDSVTIVVAAMEYILRRFKASRILTSSAGICEAEVTEALELLAQIPTGFNLTAISPNVIEYFTALLSTHMLYIFNCTFYILLLLSQNKLAEVEKNLGGFYSGCPWRSRVSQETSVGAPIRPCASSLYAVYYRINGYSGDILPV